MSQYPDPERPVASLDPSELRRRLASESIALLDVRNRSEIEEWRLPATDRTGERPATHERIVAVDLGRETVEDREAFELEPGPNDCAAG